MEGRRLRVLFYTHYSEMYGANQAMVSLITDLRNRYDIEPIVISRKKGELDGVLDSLSIMYFKTEWFPWRMPQKRNKFFFRLGINLLNNTIFFIQNSIVAKKIKPDIIHMNTSVSSLGICMALRLNKPCIWHFREFGDCDYNLSFMISEDKACSLFKKANKIIAVSNTLRLYYEEKWNLDNIITIYDGVNKPFINKINRRDGALNICAVGKICEGKNQIEIVKAIAYLHKCNINNINLFLFGSSDFDYERKIRKYAEQHGIEERIHFMGFCNDISLQLVKMDMGIMPSKSEAFGLVTIEYMLAGLTVVASNSGANSEIIEHGITGYLYSSGNIEELGSIISMCIENQDESLRIALNGKERAMNAFSQTKNSDLIYNTYKEVMHL